MSLVTFAEFDRHYQKAVDGIAPCVTPEVQRLVAEHNRGWGDSYDFVNYLRVSSRRYYLAYEALLRHGKPPESICDVGGLWGVFPVTLKALGFQVTMTEALQYYGEAFDQLFQHIRAQGVGILDYDPFEPDATGIGPVDAITVMAVLEHYPHSLQTFMANVQAAIRPGGQLYIEVPNIAYWPKRMAFLRGVSPLTPILDIYRSKVPFTGHHHEFTMTELKDLVRHAGLTEVTAFSYNYSQPELTFLQKLRYRPLQNLAFAYLEDSREVLAILCRTPGS